MGIRNIYLNNPIGIYLFAFLIPINPKFYTIGVILLVLDLLVRKLVLKQDALLKKNGARTVNFGIAAFYIMHVIGLLHTENMDFAFMDLGMKVSFLLFPIIFFFYPITIEWVKFAKIFIFGAICSIVISLLHATAVYLDEGFYSNFFDSRLSFMMHRSYWATYLVMAYSFSWFLFFKKEINPIFTTILLVLFSLLTFMSGSKMGILILILTTIGWIGYLVVKKKAFILGIASLLLFSVVGWTIYNYSPQLNTRIKAGIESMFGGKTIDPLSTESNAARILVWTSALDEIKENFFFGAGTGDIKDQLKERNLKNGFTGIAEQNLNAHNQFFNTQLALGLLGLLALLASFIQPFVRASKDYQFIMRSIIFILFLSLLTESFFETQAGIVPGAFLLSLLGSYQKTE